MKYIWLEVLHLSAETGCILNSNVFIGSHGSNNNISLVLPLCGSYLGQKTEFMWTVFIPLSQYLILLYEEKTLLVCSVLKNCSQVAKKVILINLEKGKCTFHHKTIFFLKYEIILAAITALILSLKCEHALFSYSLSKLTNAASTPVSYTHLDVYKRQAILTD